MRFHSFLAIPLLLVFSAAAEAFGATILVNAADDVVADDGFCTLREAVIAANTDAASGAMPGECSPGAAADVIVLPAGIYTLAIAGAEEDAAATGDLDLTADVAVEGAGDSATIIDGADLDRVLDVLAGVSAEIRAVTIQNGHVSGTQPVRGGGIRNAGALVVDRCTLTGNLASLLIDVPAGSGGAIHNAPGASLTVVDSTLSSNSAENLGGGIFNEGMLVVERSTLADNSVFRVQSLGGGGIAHFAGSATLSNSTLSGNRASGNNAEGGAIRLALGVSISLVHCTLSGNDTPSPFAGADGIARGSATLANTILDDNCAAVTVTSFGGNVETVASTCGLTGPSDQVNVPVSDLALAALADNGGPTQTHAIGAASVARDAALEANCTETDQRGVLRPDGDGAPGPACDSGAFELECALDPDLCVVPPTTTTSSSTTTTSTTTSTTSTTLACQALNPLTTINTLAKGQSATNNAIVSTDVTGNIIGAASLESTANRIPVCAGTDVSTVTTDTSGTATVTKSSAGVSCGAGGNCTISAIDAVEKYTVQSQNGSDTDTLTFVPQ